MFIAWDMRRLEKTNSQIITMLIIFFIALFFLFAGIFVFTGIAFPKNSIPEKGPADFFLQVNDGTIRYRKSIAQPGNCAPVVILLHSFGSSLEMWKSVEEKIVCGTVISLDFMGFGGSIPRKSMHFSLDSHSRVLIDFMDALGIKSAILAGSSMGSSVAAWTAAQYADRVDALFLAAPSGYPGSMRHRRPMDFFYRPGILNRFFLHVANSRIFKFFFPNSLAQSALEITDSYNGQFVEGLKHIDQPTAIVWSKSDKRVPFAYHTEYLKLCRNAFFKEGDPKAGHSVAVYDPDMIAGIICDLVSNVATQVRPLNPP
jgi:pimeloyl-ACP methyl ester carboxylesterase